MSGAPAGGRAYLEGCALVALVGLGCGTRAVPEAPEAAIGAATAEAACLAPADADREGTGQLADTLGEAAVTIVGEEGCYRTYELATTQPLRHELRDDAVVDDLIDEEGVLRPEREQRGDSASEAGADEAHAEPRRHTREVAEQTGWPTARTGNDLVDGLYAMTLEEVRQVSVDSIRDKAFNRGDSVSCGEGGCFETGKHWNYVWTRDIAYAVHLGLANMDPQRARNSLEFKLSERRGGGDLQIVQDTGSGGSYPISTDRVSWAVGAWELYLHLDGEAREQFRARALEAIANTLEHDREVVYDARDGLYTGEQSFLDWREQSYPEWTANDTVHVGMSKALSTNLLHLRAMEVAAAMAAEEGDEARSARYAGWAAELRDAIFAKFWLEDEGLFSTFVTTALDPSPARRYDLLGSALAILFGVAGEGEAASILERYPHYGPGAPVIWPQQAAIPIYHNRGEWPFVTAYWLRAARAADNDTVADKMVRALVRGAALNLSNMENFEAATGSPWKPEGELSGPVVNSERQLWSVAGFLSMVHRDLFGIEARPEGLAIAPYITRGLRNELFVGTNELVLNDYPYRGRLVSVVVHLPPVGGRGGSYGVERVSVNGEDAPGGEIDIAALGDRNRIDVYLADDGDREPAPIEVRPADDHRQVFGPRTPRITGIEAAKGALRLALSIGEQDAADELTFTIYRDGELVADGIAGTETSWRDDDADPSAEASPCYAVASCFAASGNCSQHSPPVCFFGEGDAAIARFELGEGTVEVNGGAPSDEHGRRHVAGWGDPGDTLELGELTAGRTGAHAIRLVYANGAGPINTGITAAVARVVIADAETGEVAGEGYTMMPHLGSWERWGESSLVWAELESGRRYRLVVDIDERAINMSAFEHFEAYTGGAGGEDGPQNRANIAAIEILPR